MKAPLALVTLLIWLASCDFYDATVIIEIPQHEPRLVVNSILTSDDSIMLFAITKSVAATSSEGVGTRMENVQITLLRNGVEVDGFYQAEEDGVHRVRLQPTIGDHFKLQVDAPGLETVFSETTIPDTCTIVSMRRGGKRYDVNQEEYEALLIRIIDIPNSEDYYEIQMQGYSNCNYVIQSNGMDSIYHLDWGPYKIYSFSTPLTWLTGYNYGEGYVFSDKGFSNREIELEVWLQPYYVEEMNQEDFYDENGQVIGTVSCTSLPSAKISTISKAWYEYASKIDIHKDNQYPGLFSGEPVPMPNNIENGFGVFGATSVARRGIGGLED